MTQLRVAARSRLAAPLRACCSAFVRRLACSSSGCNSRKWRNSAKNAGCNASGSSDRSNEIVLGHYASMTGSEATFGRSTDNGIQMAIDEINAAGGVNGKKVRVITYDDKGEQREAGNAVTRLVTKDGVVAVLGEVASGLSLVGAPVCQENGVPMVSPSSTNPEVTEVGDMIFRVCFIDPFQGYVCAKFAREHEGLKATKAAILYDQTQAVCRRSAGRICESRSTSRAARSSRRKPIKTATRISRRS